MFGGWSTCGAFAIRVRSVELTGSDGFQVQLQQSVSALRAELAGSKAAESALLEAKEGEAAARQAAARELRAATQQAVAAGAEVDERRAVAAAAEAAAQEEKGRRERMELRLGAHPRPLPP